MSKKMISIAGLMFSLIFVGMLLMMWANSQSILRMEVESAGSVHSTQLPFDITLFDNRIVSKNSLLNIVEEVNSTPIGRSTVSTGKFKLYDAVTKAETSIAGDGPNTQYLTKIHYNANEAPDGIEIVEKVGK